MKKKNKSKAFRVLCGVIAFLIFSVCAIPLIAVDTAPDEGTQETTPSATHEETTVPETTEQGYTDIPEPNEPTTPIVEKPKSTGLERYSEPYSYTTYELDLLSRLVQAEGGGESYATKLKIASVVMNRVRDYRFPNTIEEVIYEPNQFSVTFLEIKGQAMIDFPATEASKKAAKDVLENGSVLPHEVLFFYAEYCTEPWLTSRAVYGTYDSTVFAYSHSEEGEFCSIQ